MQVVISGKGPSGIPTTNLVADLTGRLDEDGVSFSYAALWGALEATISWHGTLDEGFTAAADWLGNPIDIYSPSGEWLWSGRIQGVTFGSGTRKRTRSLDSYANLSRLIYDEIDAATSPANVTTANKVITQADTTGQALYGLIEYTEKPGQLVAAQATALLARNLTERQRPLYVPESGSGLAQGRADAPAIELHCYGWWYTTTLAAYTASTTGTADISTIIQAILTAVCPMISTDYSQMATTGVTAARQYSDYEPASDIIKRLVASAPGFTFGIRVNRVPYLVATSQASTAGPDYIELADGTIQDASGGTLEPWYVRPDRLLRQADFLPPTANLATVELDNVETIYLVETTHQTPASLTYKAAVAGVAGDVQPAVSSGAGSGLSSGAAPPAPGSIAGAPFITQTPSALLSAEQALSALGTGYMKSTTGTGVVTTQAMPIPPADGGTGSGALTAGSVPFIGPLGVYAEDNTALFWDAPNKRMGIGHNGPIAPLDIEIDDAATANSPRLFVIRHNTSGTPAAAFGSEFQWFLQDTVGVNNLAARLRVAWVSATAATRTSRMTLFAVDWVNTSREILRGEADGTGPRIGVLGANASARITVTGSRGGNAALASLLSALATFGFITDSTT